LAKSWKGGHSSLGPMTHWSAADDRDGLRLHGQCLGWGVGERSAPPPSMTTMTTTAARRLRLWLRRWGSSYGDYLCLVNLFVY
jgi:hypothetical protein